jgi:hypothetical protein
MKRLLLSVVSAFCCISSFAQVEKEDVDMIQAMYGKEKKELVKAFIIPEAAKQKAFWDLYNAYETERKKLGHKRVAILEKYANNYDTMNTKTTDAIIVQTMSLQKSTDALIGTYYTKIKAAVGVKEAAQFYQFEAYLLSSIRAYVLGNIPFIGELEKSAAHQH